MRTLVFVHGNSSDGLPFVEHFHAFGEAGLDCLRFDLPGHGQAPRMESYSLAIFAQALVDFVHDHKLIDYVLVGHSLGGHVVLQALAQLSPTGVLIYGVSPLSTPLATDGFQTHPEMANYLVEMVSDEDLDKIAKITFSSPQLMQDFKQKFRHTDSRVRSGIVASLVSGQYVDDFATLNQATCPVLIADCLHEHVVNRDYFHRTFPLIRNRLVETVVWPVDHTPHVNAPELFLSETIAFAQRLPQHSSSVNGLTFSQDNSRG